MCPLYRKDYFVFSFFVFDNSFFHSFSITRSLRLDDLITEDFRTAYNLNLFQPSPFSWRQYKEAFRDSLMIYEQSCIIVDRNEKKIPKWITWGFVDTIYLAYA